MTTVASLTSSSAATGPTTTPEMASILLITNMDSSFDSTAPAPVSRPLALQEDIEVDGFEYTPRELVVIVEKMRAFSAALYPKMATLECHPFLEFCGLINKYVDLCDAAARKGIPFPLATEHNGVALPVAAHDMRYLGEKLRCIFGPTLDSDPAARDALLQTLFPGAWAP